MADGAVVGGHRRRRRRTARQPRRARRRESPGPASGSAPPARSSSSQQSSGAAPMPPPARSGRATVGRRAETAPERAEQGYRVACAELRETAGAGADVLEQELQLDAAGRVGPRAREREGARQVRALAGSATPALTAGEHVELARNGVARAGDVANGDQVVGAEPLARPDLGDPPLGRRERRGFGRRARQPARPAPRFRRPAARPPRPRGDRGVKLLERDHARLRRARPGSRAGPRSRPSSW